MTTAENTFLHSLPSQHPRLELNKAAKVLVACLSNGNRSRSSIKKCFYETIYGTTKFEFHKFTSTKDVVLKFLEAGQKHILSLTSL